MISDSICHSSITLAHTDDNDPEHSWRQGMNCSSHENTIKLLMHNRYIFNMLENSFKSSVLLVIAIDT